MDTKTNDKTPNGGGQVEAVVSRREIDILKHALGWPKVYRNHFVTGEGSDDYDDCERLVGKGLLTRQRLDWVPDYIYTVTQKGREILAG